MPNAGKSTLLSVLSNARPKIADYPFTTLEPNLGVLRDKDCNIILADIPGLIDGASEGRGLGDKFLKHIERTKMIVHVVSALSETPLEDYRTIKNELKAFSKDLSIKKEIVVLNKVDCLMDKEIDNIEKIFKKKRIKVLSISAATSKNITELVNTIKKSLAGCGKNC